MLKVIYICLLPFKTKFDATVKTNKQKTLCNSYIKVIDWLCWLCQSSGVEIQQKQFCVVVWWWSHIKLCNNPQKITLSTMKWSVKQLCVGQSVVLVMMHWTCLGSRSSRLQEAASWVAATMSALLLRYVLDERWDFPFGNQWLVLTSTSISFSFSLWFLCPLSSCTTHLFFASLLCVLSSFVHLTICAYTQEHGLERKLALFFVCQPILEDLSSVIFFVFKAVLYSSCASAIGSDVRE